MLFQSKVIDKTILVDSDFIFHPHSSAVLIHDRL